MRRAGERRRRATAGLAAVVAWAMVTSPGGTAAATPATSSAPSLQAVTTVLPTFGTGDPTATHAAHDINDRGQIVGQSADRPVLWKDGQITDLAPGRPDMFRAYRINDRGQVLGQAEDVVQHAYLLTDGQVVDIDGDADSSQGHDLNERGEVYLTRTEGDHAAVGVWRDGTFREIVAPAGAVIDMAFTLSENGHVAGTFRRGVCYPPGQGCTVQAFVWQDGALTVLPGSGRATSVNASGHVIGTGPGNGGVVWRDGVATALGIVPSDIDDAGRIVGSARTWWGFGPLHAHLWQDGRAYDLGTLGGTTSIATRINERGQVTGTSTTADGATHAFLWDAGRMYDLGPAAGPPTALNDRGQAVGHSADPGIPPRAPVLWELR